MDVLLPVVGLLLVGLGIALLLVAAREWRQLRKLRPGVSLLDMGRAGDNWRRLFRDGDQEAVSNFVKMRATGAVLAFAGFLLLWLT